MIMMILLDAGISPPMAVVAAAAAAAAELHFVRCIKPNGCKERNRFEPFEVLRQLRYISE
jgi:hypothetical protein